MNQSKSNKNIHRIQLKNNLNDIKQSDNNVIKENYPIINILKLSKNDKSLKKSESFKSQKKSKNSNSKLPFLSLSKTKVNNLKINTLLNLEPFFTDFNIAMDKKGKEILKEIACDYREEKYEQNKIIFRYGDEADKFYLIYDGKVSLFFPFTEIAYMNIDEFFIYISRLRRYNEIEMLNAVLLLLI